MSVHIELFLTPIPFGKANLEQKTAVIIDVLRSSTSICAALMADAKGVIPVEGPGEAGDLWTKIGSDGAVLAGERDGVKIENFQLGNSPTEFTRDTVGNKFVVMTTTNGTGLFGKAHKADPVISCGLVNISMVAEKIAKEAQQVVIACSGREGHFSIEDTLCGGMLIHLLQEKHGKELTLNDAASVALMLYQNNRDSIQQAIQNGEHARTLGLIGFANDVDIATEIDSMPVLPLLQDGRLILGS